MDNIIKTSYFKFHHFTTITFVTTKYLVEWPEICLKTDFNSVPGVMYLVINADLSNQYIGKYLDWKGLIKHTI